MDEQAFYGDDEKAKAELIAQIRKCCVHNGFFQIVGHRVPSDLQEDVLKCVKKFFALPQEQKEQVLKGEPSLYQQSPWGQNRVD